MYNVHYNVIKERYANSLFTDTYSLCCHIKTKDVYQDMIDLDGEGYQYFDRSEYPKGFKTLKKNENEESIFVLNDTHEKKNGFFKDQTTCIIIEEFVGLRSKM
jgi:hypothetical protein